MSDRSIPAAVAAVLPRLAALRGLHDFAAAELKAMPAKGISHDHWRIGGRGLVLRVPRLSQLGLGAAENLACQEAAFVRLHASGHTPRLAGVVPPEAGLPGGALVVEEIVGRPPRLPDDLPALVEALASVHRLPVPPPAARPPLATHADAFRTGLAAIRAALAYLPRARVAPAAARQIEAELADLCSVPVERLPPCPATAVLTDTHPGNFLVLTDGRAFAVDLEKAAYGPAPVDLAHLMLPTSTGWDPDVDAVLDPADADAALASWARAVPPTLAAAVEPWLAPMRRLTWLRTTAFFLKWRVESEGRGAWSAGRLGPAAAGHFRRHVARCLSPGTIAEIRERWLRS